MVDSIFVDGRKDATMTMVEVNGNYHRQTVIEEHYVIAGEPNDFYFSHVMPEDETECKIAASIHSAIKDTALDQKLKIVGSDGTAVITGKRKRFIASLAPPRRLSSYDDGEENAAHPHMMICRLRRNACI